MTEENNQAADSGKGERAAPKFAVQRIYLKDISFETPMGPAVFQKQVKPEINQDISLSTTKLGTIGHSAGPHLHFEVHQGGIFAIQGVEGPQLAQLLNTICPSTLFPYVREAIDSVVIKGSFPALMIPPVNFEALFAKAVEEGKLQGKGESESVTH